MGNTIWPIIFFFVSGVAIASIRYDCGEIIDVLVKVTEGRATADFLVQKDYGFEPDPRFTEPMGIGIDLQVNRLKLLLAEGKEIKRIQVETALEMLASIRRGIALDKREDPNTHLYGELYERSVDTVTKDGTFKDYYKKAIQASQDYYRKWIPNLPTDRIFTIEEAVEFAYPGKFEISEVARLLIGKNLSPEENIRREKLLGQIELREKIEKGLERTIGGKTVRFSQIIYTLEHGELVVKIVHPTKADAKIMREHAYDLLVEVLNTKNPVTKDLDKLAYAFNLLMHATPFTRGSPSVVESYMDVIFRVKFDHAITGQKVYEPFWKAVLWDVDKPFTAKDLLKCYSMAP